MIFKTLRKNTIRAKTNLDIITLDKTAYNTVISDEFPEIAKRMVKEAKDKNKNSRQKLAHVFIYYNKRL